MARPSDQTATGGHGQSLRGGHADRHPLLANPLLKRAEAFCATYGLRVPILLAPMAGACPASLSIAVANAGGLGGCGAF